MKKGLSFYVFLFKFIELKEPITDLDKMTLEHLKLDNARILLETEVLKKESQKITIESSFSKIKEEYFRLKM